MPTAVVNQVVPQLISKGKVPRPGIGIMVLDQESTASLGVMGVVIDRVQPGSSADQSGLVGIDYRNRILGDVILSVDGNDVKNIVEFVRLLQNYEIGQTVNLKLKRGEEVRDVAVSVMDIS